MSFTPYHDRHTSDNISSELGHRIKILNTFGTVTTITCDGASNMAAPFKKLDSRIKRLQCLKHKLYLIICNRLGLWTKDRKEDADTQSDGEKNIRFRFFY